MPARIGFLTLLLFVLAAPRFAGAQSATAGQPMPDMIPGRVYEKGATEWGIVAGGALPVDLSSARPDRRLWLAALELGRIMTREHGPRPLAGQLEMLVQAMPIVVRGPADFWGVGLSPLFLRWNFSGAGRLRPYAELSAGLMLIDWDEPGPGHVTRNFNEQVGVGLRVGGSTGRGAVVGYRFQHISNGSRTIASPGIDTHLVFVGFRSLR
jgi:hypothetical protein